MNYKVLLYYTNLALSQEDNDFVANFMESGSKIIEQEINEKSGDKYQIEIDFLHLEKGEKGLEQLLNKIDTYEGLLFTHAHPTGKYNKTILEHLNKNEFFYFHLSSALGTDKHLLDVRKSYYDARIAFINNEIDQLKGNNIFYLHNEVRLYERILADHKSLPNFQDYSFRSFMGIDDITGIKSLVNEIFSNLKKNDLIILDLGLKYFREVFSYLEENELTNKVISSFGSVENRFQKISFELIQLITSQVDTSLSQEDLMNKVFKEDIGAERRALLHSSAYRLEYPILVSQALNKCDDNDIQNKDFEKIRSAILSFDGKKDIFFGKYRQWGFNEEGVNILKDNFAYVFPNSLQSRDYKTPKILYHTQFRSVDSKVQKSRVIFGYIDILSVTNIDISSRFWTAEFYIDIVSLHEDPIDEILFNNLSSLNDKFSYKKVWRRDDKFNYNTQRYYVVANFDFFPKIENYPFDWQNIYIAMTIKNDKEQILQPIPLDLLDHDFEISGWTIENDFSGIKYQKNHLFQDANLQKSVSINSENRAGWILKRKNNATLFKIGIPMSFLIFLVYYTTFSTYAESGSSIGILTTTFLSSIALYFSVEKPEPKKMTIVDLIFIWFYIVNGVTVVTCGIASSLSENIFYLSNSILKALIPLSLISMGVYLWRRIRRSRNDIILDRDV